MSKGCADNRIENRRQYRANIERIFKHKGKYAIKEEATPMINLNSYKLKSY